MKKNLLVVFMLVAAMILTACAVTHPGQLAKIDDGGKKFPIKLSATNIKSNSTKALQLIEVTIENTSDNWLRIQTAKVIINDPAESKLSVVVGNDLTNWAQALTLKKKMEDHNDQLLIEALRTVSVATVAVGYDQKNMALANAGLIGLAGTEMWAAVDTLISNRNFASQTEKVPENHLYNSFSVPPGMFLRKWVLMNKPVDKVINSFVIEVEMISGEKGLYVVSM